MEGRVGGGGEGGAGETAESVCKINGKSVT